MSTESDVVLCQTPAESHPIKDWVYAVISLHRYYKDTACSVMNGQKAMSLKRCVVSEYRGRLQVLSRIC